MLNICINRWLHECPLLQRVEHRKDEQDRELCLGPHSPRDSSLTRQTRALTGHAFTTEHRRELSEDILPQSGTIVRGGPRENIDDKARG